MRGRNGNGTEGNGPGSSDGLGGGKAWNQARQHLEIPFSSEKKKSFLVEFLKRNTEISSNAVDEEKRPRRTWKRRLEESQTARSPGQVEHYGSQGIG